MSLTKQELLSLAKAWVYMHSVKENSPEWEDTFWSYIKLGELISEAPNDAWEAINEIRKLDGSDHILLNLAAGPLEDFLVYHGEDFIDRIEDACKEDDQLRKLLGATWQNDMSNSLWLRIKLLASSSW